MNAWTQQAWAAEAWQQLQHTHRMMSYEPAYAQPMIHGGLQHPSPHAHLAAGVHHFLGQRAWH